MLAAVAAFNRGDPDALRVAGEDDSATHRTRSQQRLGCSPSSPCRAARPMPLTAGDVELRVKETRALDHRRVVCSMETQHGIELVGIYAVDAGEITAACHYFSDVEMLVRVGIISDPATATDAKRAPDEAARTLRDSLAESRLEHRRQRLALVLSSLRERIRSAERGGAGVPRPLIAATREFESELADVSEQLRALKATNHVA